MIKFSHFSGYLLLLSCLSIGFLPSSCFAWGFFGGLSAAASRGTISMATESEPPKVNVYTAGPNMLVARQTNGATLLPSGEIFVSGGTTTQCGYDSIVNSTELFE